ncbi:slit homolog 3 protein-like [Sycon ciliatum]|uniref:slit homolog 3 protein-like n=1 Tax=Sycon ciliatum TaxID=27933 RepID=UPI0031F6CD29
MSMSACGSRPSSVVRMCRHVFLLQILLGAFVLTHAQSSCRTNTHDFVCDGQHLQRVPAALRGANPSSVLTASLANNSISSLVKSDFSGLGNLRTLNLDNNAISSPPEDVFEWLVQLKSLSMNKNQITSLEADVFSPLRDLEYLSFSGNKLNQLKPSLFLNLLNLKHLSFADNDVTLLQYGTFLMNTQLSSILAKNNRMYAIAIGSFENLPRGATIDIPGDYLEAAPRDLCPALDYPTKAFNFVFNDHSAKYFLRSSPDYKCDLPCYLWRPWRYDICNNRFCVGTVGSFQCKRISRSQVTHYRCEETSSTLTMDTSFDHSYSDAARQCRQRNKQLASALEYTSGCVTHLLDKVRRNQGLSYRPVAWIAPKYHSDPYASNGLTYYADRQLKLVCSDRS